MKKKKPSEAGNDSVVCFAHISHPTCHFSLAVAVQRLYLLLGTAPFNGICLSPSLWMFVLL